MRMKSIVFSQFKEKLSNGLVAQFISSIKFEVLRWNHRFLCIEISSFNLTFFANLLFERFPFVSCSKMSVSDEQLVLQCQNYKHECRNCFNHQTSNYETILNGKR